MNRIDIGNFRRALISWGSENFRDFPWRRTDDAYRILIAEIMLHRTQAPQVVPVYLRFIERYPDLELLARAERKELHQFLYPLGLRWRIDAMHRMAVMLAERFDGQIPADRDVLLSLPGVNEYIACAVRCFAWNLPEPLLDTNTVRVTGRLLGLQIRDSSRRSKVFRKLNAALLDRENPKAYNFALLDLADKICTARRRPACDECPVGQWCVFKATGARWVNQNGSS